jgi:hypothetical protein
MFVMDLALALDMGYFAGFNRRKWDECGAIWDSEEKSARVAREEECVEGSYR